MKRISVIALALTALTAALFACAPTQESVSTSATTSTTTIHTTQPTTTLPTTTQPTTTTQTPSPTASNTPTTTPPDTREVGPQVGKVAPAFELSDLGGTAVSLESLRGRPVMLNFWATW